MKYTLYFETLAIVMQEKNKECLITWPANRNV